MCLILNTTHVSWTDNSALQWNLLLAIGTRCPAAIEEKKYHKVKHQKDILLPSSAQHIDMFEFSERWEGEDQLISIPANDIDGLLEEYNQPNLLQFGSNEMVELCEALYNAIGTPKLSASASWEVFKAMVNYYCQHSESGLTQSALSAHPVFLLVLM